MTDQLDLFMASAKSEESGNVDRPKEIKISAPTPFKPSTIEEEPTEQVKAELSDAFKRACFNWGIGRELYYSPKIWINATNDNTTSARYSVKVIEYDDKKRITRLVIINDKTKEVVFLFGKEQKTAQNGENAHRCHNRCEECDEFQEELERLEKENKVEQIIVNGKVCNLIRKVYDSFTDSHLYYTTERDEPFCDLCDKIEVIECQNKD